MFGPLVCTFTLQPKGVRGGKRKKKEVIEKSTGLPTFAPRVTVWGFRGGGKMSAKVWGNVAVGIAQALRGMQERFE